MASEVTLTETVRSNLLSLQRTTALINTTQSRLATGLAVASPGDDAVKFFNSKSLLDRASDLAERKDGIDQGISSLTTAVDATTALEDLLDNMKGVFEASRSQTAAQRMESTGQIATLVEQIQDLIDDASYQGLNLLTSTASSLTVRFSEKDSSKLVVNGVDFNASVFFLNSQSVAIAVTHIDGVGTDVITYFGNAAVGFTVGLSGFNLSLASVLASFNEKVDSAVFGLQKTIEKLRSKAQTLATNISILNVRLDFTSLYVNTLEVGGDKLRLADLNEESANLLALQTRQQLGIQALAFAGQSEQSVLALFG
jgi:flagellin